MFKRFNYIIMALFFFCYFFSKNSEAKPYVFGRTPIVILSLPKCGTHMMIKCIELLIQNKSICEIDWVPRTGVNDHYINSVCMVIDNNKQSCFFRGHLVYEHELEKLFELKSCKVLFIYRDPRAQLASWILLNKKEFTDDCLSNQMLKLINGSSSYGWPTRNSETVAEAYQSYMPWAFCKNVFAVRFEDLVGAEGGGDSNKQFDVISKIARHIGIRRSSREIKRVCRQLFGGTATFSSGQINGWKKYFTEEHKKAFKKNAGQLLIDLGYEKDFNW